MGLVRVYVPYTLDRLATVLRDEVVGPAPFTAFAVTPAVAAATPDADLEEREHLATLAAAHASLAQLVADPAAGWRRVVLALDVDAAAIGPAVASADPSAVEVLAEVPVARVAAVLVDEPAAQAQVAVAAQTRDLDGMDDVDLLWFAPSELVALLH